MAAAVVGIGLFLAPVNQAQAQFSGSGIATVTQVDLDSFSFVVEGKLNMSLSFDFGSVFVPVFHWSGIYGWPGFWVWKSVDGDIEDRWLTSVVPAQNTSYFYHGNRSDYYVCRFGPVDWESGLRIDEVRAGLKFGFGRERRLILRLPMFTTATAISITWIWLLTAT